MYLSAPLFCKILKKFLVPSQSYEGCHFRAQNGPFVLNKTFSGTKPLSLLSSTYWSFSLCKIKKTFLQQIQSSEDVPFLGPKWSICPPKFFFGKLLIPSSSIYQPLSLCKIFQKNFPRIQSYEDAQFLGPKWPISPNENFFQKTC